MNACLALSYCFLVCGMKQLLPLTALTISIISASGALIRTMQAHGSSKVIQLDVSALASGVYTVKLISGDKVLYKQFVKS